MKSISRATFSFESTTISWYSGKNRDVALILVEDDYMVTSKATCEAIWMGKIIARLFSYEMNPTMIYYDNHSCIKLSKNLVFYDRLKRIDIWCHHFLYSVQRRIMFLQYIPTEEQDADIFTKALSRGKF